MALGIWGGVAGLAVATGPVVGGAVVQGWSWQTIFWLNVPLGLALIPIAWFKLPESHGPATRLDLPGVALASAGLFGIVLGLIRGNELGWTSPFVVTAIAVGVALVAAFVAWEKRAAEPMLPMRLFRSRGFSFTNLASVLMFFGMFGSIFLLAQFLQTVQHCSPLQAGLRTLPWTGMPMLVAPIAGILADRIGGRPVVLTGLALQALGLAWLAHVATATVSYAALVPGFVINGIGMAMFMAPVATLVLGFVRRNEEGIASGAANALRELGGVFGVAVLASVFAAHGNYLSPAAFAEGMRAAVAVGAVAVAIAAIALLGVPRRRSLTVDFPTETATAAELATAA
jgi:EmrB/QacA subfamily drug resistance transporter